MLQEYQFNDSNHALIWSVEILRARRFPKIAKFYKEAEQEGKAEVSKWRGERTNLPQDYDERLLLALKVLEVAEGTLDKLELQIVKFYYWGDFVSNEIYVKAKKFQEHMRQDGVRVRLNYRYSFRQIAKWINLTDKPIAAKYRVALDKIDIALTEKGLIQNNFKDCA